MDGFRRMLWVRDTAFGMVQFAKSQVKTFSCTQKARSHETKGFDLVVLCQECNPRLNHAPLGCGACG